MQSEDIDLQEAEQDDVLNAAMDAVMEEVDGSTTGANDDQGATSTASTPQKLSPDDDDDVAPADGEAQQTPKKHVSISYDKYTSIATMIIHHLRQLEESSEETDFVGGTTDDVVNWYLETQEENLETEEQVAEEARIVRLVLYRMVHVDNVVLELEDATLGGEYVWLTLPLMRLQLVVDVHLSVCCGVDANILLRVLIPIFLLILLTCDVLALMLILYDYSLGVGLDRMLT